MGRNDLGCLGADWKGEKRCRDRTLDDFGVLFLEIRHKITDIIV